jgi:hypothetical protein
VQCPAVEWSSFSLLTEWESVIAVIALPLVEQMFNNIKRAGSGKNEAVVYDPPRRLGKDKRVFQLAACPLGSPRHDRCILCLRKQEWIDSEWLLCERGFSLGTLCPECAAAGPTWAALTLRRRAEKVRQLAERFTASLWAWGWTGLHRLLHEHAAALDGLAECLARLSGW